MQIPARKIKFRDPTTGEIRETLLLSEGRVDEAVEEYLDAHPEKTTTVQDASLTEAKFTNDLKLKTVKDYITPEMFGAKGDGVTDDTAAFKSALNSDIDMILLTGSYVLTDVCDITDKSIISYSNAEIIMQSQTTDREWFIKATGRCLFDGIKFYQKADGKILGLLDNNYSVIRNCVFEAEDGHLVKSLLDLYSNNNNVLIANCEFIHRSTGIGGIWIRNLWDYTTSNINITDCKFTSYSGVDEILAVWGANGIVENVNITNCVFTSMATATMPHMLSLGLSGTTKNVIVSNCTIRNNGAGTSIVKCQPTGTGTAENIRVENCNLYNTKTGVEFALGRVLLNNCNLFTTVSVKIGVDDISHKIPQFSNCVINSDAQMVASLGEYYNCIFNLNGSVAESYHISQYGITLVNCVFNGLNCTGTAFQILGTTFPVMMDNVKFYGTLDSLFMTASVAASIKMNNVFFGKKFNISSADATGYIVNCFSYSDALGTTGNLTTSNNVFNFTI